MIEPLNAEVAILNAALELPTEQRAAYLDKACGRDTALRQQLNALLEAHDRADDFLETPPAGLDFNHAGREGRSPTEKPGDKIGRYKLLQQIGEGGCGIVYMAEQEEPVRRRVALKVIKLGMDTRQVIGRFEAERQALALMDHPNIAKVLDAGATDAGRPYFVMELVQGVRITEFCDTHRISTEERLKLFIQVCQAIQHAHQKGVIHRDIKPSNILVTINDGVPVPKVIDFGIAKATQGRLTDQTLSTAFAQFIGTPAYMSPEQALMTSADIDTRSDIYSLGVLLYELLTGRTPFDQKELLAAGLDGMRRTICEKEPLKPSTQLTQEFVAADGRRFHSKSEEEMGASSRRLLQMKESIHVLRGDLDWIVMKCLEKERERRYETANGLAMDIGRHLNNEPVSARPPSNLYRLQKSLRRNKTAFGAATSIAIVLVIAAILSLSQAIRARRAEREQIRLGAQARVANRDLRDTVNVLELQRAENFFRNGDAGTAVAHLAAMLRRDPSNHVAGSRLVSALAHRNWALRASATMNHSNRIESLSFSPSGKHILSAGRDQTAKIWDASTGKAVALLHHADQVFCAHYDSGGGRIVTASADGTAQIWDSATGEPRAPPLRHEGKVYWAEFSVDDRWVVTASADTTARIWDSASGALKHELRKHTSHVVLARFSRDSKRLATGGSHGSIRIWNVDTGEMLFRIEDRARPLTAMEFSPDGNRLFSVCQDEIVRLWNLETRTEIHLPLENEPMDHAAFSPDSKFLLTASRDARARIWDTDTGLPIGPPLVHDGGVAAGEFSVDGRKIATLSREHAARLWDARTRLPLCQPIRVPEEFKEIDFSPDGGRLVTGGRDGTIHVWDIQPRRFAGLETRFETAITCVAFSPDGATLLAASWDGTVRLLDVRTGKTLSVLPHQAGLYLAEFTPDGNRVFTASANGEVRLWNWRKAALESGPFQHSAKIRFVHFDTSGDRLLIVASDGTLRVWEPGTWQPLTPPMAHRGVLMSRFSADGRFLVSAGEDHAARIWAATTGEPVGSPLLHKDHVKWAEFGPDGKRILTASTDDTACVWDLQSGLPVSPPLQHARIVEMSHFSIDGNRVITASLDRTARIWDARTGGALSPPLKHDYSLVAACFARDGELAMTGCWNGTLRAWNVKTGQPVTESLEVGGWISRLVAFDPGGRGMATGGRDSVVRVWHVPSIPTPVPEWFLTFTESVAGIRLGDQGQVELVHETEFDATIQAFKSKDKNEFYGRLAQWFLADPTDREPAPF